MSRRRRPPTTDPEPERTPEPSPVPTPEPTPEQTAQATPSTGAADPSGGRRHHRPTPTVIRSTTTGRARSSRWPRSAVCSPPVCLEGLAWRRSVQLQTRPRGRRIPPPPPATLPVAAALTRKQRPLSLRTLDRAMRAISAHCRATGTPPPPLRFALVGDDQIELVLAEAVVGRADRVHRRRTLVAARSPPTPAICPPCPGSASPLDRGRPWSRWAGTTGTARCSRTSSRCACCTSTRRRRSTPRECWRRWRSSCRSRHGPTR